MNNSAIIETPTYLSNRTVIRLSSTDGAENVRDFLQGLVTQDMDSVANNAASWSALLSAQGKLMFEFLLWGDGVDILIDCERAVVEALIRRLTIYRLRRKIAISQDSDLSVHWSKTDPKSGAIADPRLEDLGFRWIASNTKDIESADADWLQHRLNHGVAEGQDDFGLEKILWLECNAEELNGVSYTKGCFIGQENTARMHYRSKINRRVAIVPVGLADEKRVRNAYDEANLAIVHAPVADMSGWPLPEWQKNAIRQD